MRKLGAQTSARVAAEEQLDKLRSDRQGGSLTLSTLVRVALADPGLNGRRLRDILSLEGSSFTSASYAAKVKDAFVELLKDVCKQHIRAQVAASPRAPSGQIVAPVFVTHVHDEASMRAVTGCPQRRTLVAPCSAGAAIRKSRTTQFLFRHLLRPLPSISMSSCSPRRKHE